MKNRDKKRDPDGEKPNKPVRFQGTVASIHLDKMFGFIRPNIKPEKVKEVYFHLKEYRDGVLLQKNYCVEYYVVGDRATDVRLIKAVVNHNGMKDFLAQLSEMTAEKFLLSVSSDPSVWLTVLLYDDGKEKPMEKNKRIESILRLATQPDFQVVTLKSPLETLFHSFVSSSFMSNPTILSSYIQQLNSQLSRENSRHSGEESLKIVIEFFYNLLNFGPRKGKAQMDLLQSIPISPVEFLLYLPTLGAELKEEIVTFKDVYNKRIQNALAGNNQDEPEKAVDVHPHTDVSRDHYQISIYPTADEITNPESPIWRHIPINRIKGSYTNVADYLYTHFML